MAGILPAPPWLTVLVAVAVATRLEDGGLVFCAQKRLGRGGPPFGTFKFRAMVEGAERRRGANVQAEFISDNVPSNASPVANLLSWANAGRGKMIVSSPPCCNSTPSRLTRKQQFVD